MNKSSKRIPAAEAFQRTKWFVRVLIWIIFFSNSRSKRHKLRYNAFENTAVENLSYKLDPYNFSNSKVIGRNSYFMIDLFRKFLEHSFAMENSKRKIRTSKKLYNKLQRLMNFLTIMWTLTINLDYERHKRVINTSHSSDNSKNIRNLRAIGIIKRTI